VDLDDWTGAGHRAERLDDLDALAAREVLRGWGVQGDNAVLDALTGRLHGHALSVAVLGSYLGHFCGGDPAKAPLFDRNEAAADDPKAARLGRILGEYARALSSTERDLLARLAAFPRGVKVVVLAYLVEAGGQVAGALAGYHEERLVQLLERLRNLGLVFSYPGADEVTYTAHPFLRDYFKGLLGVPAENVHEAVRSRLAPSLETRPKNPPTETAALDRYEALIEHTRLAGRTQDAHNLYWYGLGGYDNLNKVLGENARGLRILTAFSPDGTVENAALDLPAGERSSLVSAWGHHSMNFGDLNTARRAFGLNLAIRRQLDDAGNCSRAQQNLARVELLGGRFSAAREAAQEALAYAEKAGETIQRKYSHTSLASALAALGDMADTRRHFDAATKLEGKPLYSVRGIREAEFRLACGDVVGTQQQTRANREICQRNGWSREVALCDTLLGQLLLSHNPAAAQSHLDAAREFGARSGGVEIQLRTYRLAAELAQHLGDLPTAMAEAEAGLLLADGCGFGQYAIELRLSLARIHLDAGDARAALRRAREALDRATAPECRYAWGEADALDLAGRAHARLREIELARQRLTAAIGVRERLSHPRLDNTRTALATLGPG
jgi:tetratricopeptide (TPR) repeat protein